MHRLMAGNLVCRVSWPGRQKTWLTRDISMVQQGLSHFVRLRGEALVPKERGPGRTEWGRGNQSDNPFLRQRELHPRWPRGCQWLSLGHQFLELRVSKRTWDSHWSASEYMGEWLILSSFMYACKYVLTYICVYIWMNVYTSMCIVGGKELKLFKYLLHLALIPEGTEVWVFSSNVGAKILWLSCVVWEWRWVDLVLSFQWRQKVRN